MCGKDVVIYVCPNTFTDTRGNKTKCREDSEQPVTFGELHRCGNVRPDGSCGHYLGVRPRQLYVKQMGNPDCRACREAKAETERAWRAAEREVQRTGRVAVLEYWYERRLREING
jgi:hypothetical protein